MLPAAWYIRGMKRLVFAALLIAAPLVASIAQDTTAGRGRGRGAGGARGLRTHAAGKQNQEQGAAANRHVLISFSQRLWKGRNDNAIAKKIKTDFPSHHHCDAIA